MKRFRYFLLFSFLFSLSINSLCQSTKTSEKEQRRVARIEKRKTRQEAIEKQYELIKEVAYSKEFYIENDYAPESNYLMIDSCKSLITNAGTSNYYKQPMNSFVWINYNALGGITLIGEVRNYKVRTNDRRKLVIINYDIFDPFSFTSYVEIRINYWGTGSAEIRESNNTDEAIYGVEYLGGRVHFLDGKTVVPEQGLLQ